MSELNILLIAFGLSSAVFFMGVAVGASLQQRWPEGPGQIFDEWFLGSIDMGCREPTIWIDFFGEPKEISRELVVDASMQTRFRWVGRYDYSEPMSAATHDEIERSLG